MKRKRLKQQQDRSNTIMEDQPGDPAHDETPDCPACQILFGRYAESFIPLMDGEKDPWLALALFLSDFSNNLVTMAMAGTHPVEMLNKTARCANALMGLQQLQEAAKALGIYNEAGAGQKVVIVMGRHQPGQHRDYKPGGYV